MSLKTLIQRYIPAALIMIFIAGSDIALGKENAVIVLSDMSQCTPATALTRDYEKDKWQMHDYETDDGLKGTMVTALPESRVRELKLPLNVEGFYKIYLGVHYTRPHVSVEHSSYGAMEVKLSGDAGFRRVGLELEEAELGSDVEGYKTLHESYWKTADLTGESLIIRQQQYPYNRFHIPEDIGYPVNLLNRDRKSVV